MLAAAKTLPLLTTARLELAYPTEADLPALYPIYTDPLMTAHLGGPLERAFVDSMVPRWQAHWAARGYGNGVLRRRDGGGGAGAVVGAFALFHSEFAGATLLEIGWMVALAAQRQGLATEAAHGLVEHVRTALPAERTISAFPGTANAASNRICEKLGFALVGTRSYRVGEVRLETHHWRLELR